MFLVNLPLGIIIITFVFWKLKGEWAEARGEKFDLSGSIIYGLSIVALMVGLSLLPSATAIWPALAGMLGIAVFIWWETKVESPLPRTSSHLRQSCTSSGCEAQGYQ